MMREWGELYAMFNQFFLHSPGQSFRFLATMVLALGHHSTGPLLRENPQTREWKTPEGRKIYFLQAVGLFPFWPNLGKAVSWSMHSGKLLSWYPSRPALCNAVSCPCSPAGCWAGSGTGARWPARARMGPGTPRL